MTLADFRTNLTKEVIDEVKSYFKEKVYNAIIPRTVKLTEAPGFGQPIALYARDSVGAEKYAEVVDEILALRVSTESIENKEVTEVLEGSHGQEIG